MLPQKLAILIIMINLSYFSLNAQVGIGTTDPPSSSALEVSSPNSGFLPPRLNTANRDAITNPAAGLMIYNLDENCINFGILPNGLVFAGVHNLNLEYVEIQ